MVTMETFPHIKVKALAWIEDQDNLFVVKMTDKAKKDDYYRPIGGTVEFGELTRETLIREVHEELNTEVQITGQPLILENLYTCDGESGHEIVYLYPCRFIDQSFYERKILPLTEVDGTQWQALWVNLADFLDRTYRLVPETLYEFYAAQNS